MQSKGLLNGRCMQLIRCKAARIVNGTRGFFMHEVDGDELHMQETTVL